MNSLQAGLLGAIYTNDRDYGVDPECVGPCARRDIAQVTVQMDRNENLDGRIPSPVADGVAGVGDCSA